MRSAHAVHHVYAYVGEVEENSADLQGMKEFREGLSTYEKTMEEGKASKYGTNINSLVYIVCNAKAIRCFSLLLSQCVPLHSHCLDAYGGLGRAWQVCRGQRGFHLL